MHARREGLPHHERACDLLRGLVEGEVPWALPWPCVYEFLLVVTHPRVFDPPSSLDDLDSLLSSPSLLLIGEGKAHRSHLRRMVEAGRATGNLAHDAHIAALVIEHGADELWTVDRDFARFPGLRTRDRLREPLSPGAGGRASSLERLAPQPARSGFSFPGIWRRLRGWTGFRSRSTRAT